MKKLLTVVLTTMMIALPMEIRSLGTLTQKTVGLLMTLLHASWSPTEPRLSMTMKL